MKFNIFCGLVIFIFVSFLVPQLDEEPTKTTESLTSLTINPARDRILVRTDEHDYEFVLPRNRIGMIIEAAPMTDPLIYWSIDKLTVLSSGKTHSVLNSDYRPGEKTLDSPVGMVSRLKGLGYVSPDTMTETDADFTLNLRMDLLEGQQYAQDTKSDFIGNDLITENSSNRISVGTLTDEQARNKNINLSLKPFTLTRKAVESFLGFIHYCILGILLIGSGVRLGG